MAIDRNTQLDLTLYCFLQRQRDSEMKSWLPSGSLLFCIRDKDWETA